MNLVGKESELLSREVVDSMGDFSGVDVVICPPFTSMERVARVIEGSRVKLGAQNMHWERDGSYTGEISGSMLLTCGCHYVILGHSERRTYFGETDITLNQRLKAALGVGLIPVVCVGETLEERKLQVTGRVVKKQITGALGGLSSEEMGRVVMAYEPVWAIGTGLTATPEQAQSVHSFIREVLAEFFSAKVFDAVCILYGGSVKPENAANLFRQPDIDGGLIGGSALQAESFSSIIKSAI